MLLTLNAFLIGSKMLIEICETRVKTKWANWLHTYKDHIAAQHQPDATCIAARIKSITRPKEKENQAMKNQEYTLRNNIPNHEYIECVMKFIDQFSRTVCSIIFFLLNCHWTAKYIAYKNINSFFLSFVFNFNHPWQQWAQIQIKI